MLILTVLQGPDKGRLFELPDSEPQMIGRSSEALPLQDETISRRHAALTPDDGRWYIVDLESANGTYVNGKRVTDRKLLRPGDQIRTGVTLFVFGMDGKTIRRRGVRVVKPSQMDTHVEKTAPSTDDALLMAVPEPSTAAVIQLKVVYELTELIGSATDRQDLLERVMSLIFDYFDADRGFILLQDDPNARPDPVVVRYRHAGDGGEPPPIPVSRTIVHHVMRKGEAILSSNAMTDERFAGGDSVQGYGIRSALCVPIRYKDRTYGVIHLDSQIADYTFTEDQLRLCTAIGVHTALALANLNMYDERVGQERLAAVGQTVASLSHSIKNILQGMRGGADLVEMGLKKDSMKGVRGGWEIVSRNLERIYALTLNMLAYSKRRRPELVEADLHALINEISSLMQNQFDQRQVALITDIALDLPSVAIDVSGIHQALLNLLNNALEAVEPESGAVTLRADYDEEQGYVRIRVSDNGVGIESERLIRLFQPFQSTKGLRGTGLGLVVTKKIVEEHGGTIGVDSRPGSGTTFTIRLPRTHDVAMGSSGDTLSDTMHSDAVLPHVDSLPVEEESADDDE